MQRSSLEGKDAVCCYHTALIKMIMWDRIWLEKEKLNILNLMH